MHRLNPSIKIVLMFVLAVGAFYVPTAPAFIIWILLILLSKVILHFSFAEILKDLKPVLMYLFILYVVSVIINIASFFTLEKELNGANIIRLFYPDLSYTSLLMKLSLSIEITSIFYRTTSIQQFNQGFASIEHFITRKDETPFSDILSLTITFIPRLVSFWYRIDNAYKARGGKDDLKRIVTLVPVLFNVGMREAYLKAMARENRL